MKNIKVKVIPPPEKEDLALINLQSKDQEVKVTDLFVLARQMPVSAYPKFSNFPIPFI